MEINNDMREFYRLYFEPTTKMRTNLIGTVQFQEIQSNHTLSVMLAKTKDLQTKYREMQQKLVRLKGIEREKALATRRKTMIIFGIIREQKLR